MNTLVHDQGPVDGPGFADPDASRLPRRPRRRYLNKASLAVTAAVTCAAGFYAGVRVERGQLSTAGTTSGSSFSALAARLRSGAGATAGGSSTRGAAAGGFPGLAGGAGAAGASVGTVASVNGRSLYVAETSGNTVKVVLSSSTKVTKSLGVRRSAVRPGDTVVVRGAPNARGTLVAATVSDSGNSASGSRSGSSTGSGGSGSGLSSLFSSGG